MPIDPSELQRGSGCGVQGCLFAAVALFAVLLVSLLVIAGLRFREATDEGGVGRRTSWRLEVEVEERLRFDSTSTSNLNLS